MAIDTWGDSNCGDAVLSPELVVVCGRLAVRRPSALVTELDLEVVDTLREHKDRHYPVTATGGWNVSATATEGQPTNVSGNAGISLGGGSGGSSSENLSLSAKAKERRLRRWQWLEGVR